jgi:hypothetical protein
MVIFLLFMMGCVSRSEFADVVFVERLIFDNVSFRIPGVGQNWQVGLDYFRAKQDQFSCLMQIKESLTVNFEFDSVEPSFVLQEDSQTPDCVKKSLSKIFVPKEIFFQSFLSSRRLACFHASLDSQDFLKGILLASEQDGIPALLKKQKVLFSVSFPLEKGINTLISLRRYLLVWSLAAYLSHQRESLKSVLVEDSFCRHVMKKAFHERAQEDTIELWPG